MNHVLISLLLLASELAASAAERVEILFDVPAGLEEFTGKQPVTFGVPFEKGTLRKDHGLRIVDEAGKPLPSQFEVTATWTPQGDDVRWLLVDCFADIRNGKAAHAFLEFGTDVSRSETASKIAATQEKDRVTVQMGARMFAFGRDGGSLGNFVLRDGDGREYITGRSDSGWKIEIEKSGPVRAVVKMTGTYADAEGRAIAEFVTRARLYPNCHFMRVYHTMTWLTNDTVRIGELTFHAAAPKPGKTAAGLDGQAAIANDDGSLVLRQTDWNQVEGTVTGKQLDGWIQHSAGNDSLFLGLRWPWQQYPTAFEATKGSLSVKLIGPSTPMSLKPLDVAVPAVLHNVKSWNLRIFKGGLPMNDVIYNGPPALEHLTPRGVAKTWEMLIWLGDEKIDPATKNILAQHPVLAYADPAFATRAALPSPASPYDSKQFPEVESALQRAFDYFTRERAEDGDFGTWNYGDLQWEHNESGYPIYRYWMNCGKGWSILPWALWIRSGDRRYWENGEANSRHCMDVDTCHVPGWSRDPNDFRLRGGQYHYSALHWGYGPEVFTYYVDSEYLPYAWYMTGYERAKDMLIEHAEAVIRYEQREAILQHFRDDLPVRASRHLYVMVKNLCVLYEATWDERLRSFADECLKLTEASQTPSGNFHGVKTNHYLDEPLNIAARVFGWERVGKMLQRWQDCLGDPLRPGPNGGISGPMSLWSSVSLYEHTGNAHHLDVAAKVMNAQAATVARQLPFSSDDTQRAAKEISLTPRFSGVDSRDPQERTVSTVFPASAKTVETVLLASNVPNTPLKRGVTDRSTGKRSTSIFAQREPPLSPGGEEKARRISGSEWQGINNIPGHEAGPALRDWPIAMCYLAKLPEEKRPRGYVPVGAFHSMIPPTKEQTNDGWGMRHVALTLNEAGKDFTLDISFAQQPEVFRLRVLRPDGSAAIEETVTLPKFTVAYEKTPTRRSVPSNRQKGAYVIDIQSKWRPDLGTPVHIQSSTRRIVHYMPEGRRNFTCSHYAGQFWFQPIAGAEVSLSLLNDTDVVGRTVALDPLGRVIAESTVTGSRPVKMTPTAAAFADVLPVGTPCRLQAPANPGNELYSFVMAGENKWNRWWTIRGIKPFVSATKEEWFDPTQHPCAPIATWGVK